MRRVLFACLSLLSLQLACSTPGSMQKDGFEHSALGYEIPLVPGTQNLIDDRWVLEKQTAKTYSAASKNQDGVVESVRFRSIDLVLKHKETRGVIAVQSFPLDEVNADRNPEVVAKEYAELLSGAYYAQLGTGKGEVDNNLVITMGKAKVGTLRKGTTYEVDFEVSQANSKQALRKYRMTVIRFKPEFGWILEKSRDPKKTRYSQYPAAIVVTYANDTDYFASAAPAFDALVSRIRLRD